MGCAASAAEGTGCAGGAIGGAASAAFAPDLITAMDPGSAPLTTGQQAAIAAFATFAGGAAAGLTGQNMNAAVFAAQNEAINNCLGDPRSCTQLLKSAASSFVTSIGGPSTFLQVMAMLQTSVGRRERKKG